MGDFSEALQTLLGLEAPGLSAGTVSRLKRVWKKELADWKQRDLSPKNASTSGWTAFTCRPVLRNPCNASWWLWERRRRAKRS